MTNAIRTWTSLIFASPISVPVVCSRPLKRGRGTWTLLAAMASGSPRSSLGAVQAAWGQASSPFWVGHSCMGHGWFLASGWGGGREGGGVKYRAPRAGRDVAAPAAECAGGSCWRPKAQEEEAPGGRDLQGGGRGVSFWAGRGWRAP